MTNDCVVKIGLRQINREGLLRIKKHIEDGKPVLLNGEIVDELGHM